MTDIVLSLNKVRAITLCVYCKPAPTVGFGLLVVIMVKCVREIGGVVNDLVIWFCLFTLPLVSLGMKREVPLNCPKMFLRFLL